MRRTDDEVGKRVQPETEADETETTTRALRFLSDANRLGLIKCLADQEACVFELTGHLDLPQSLVSYHLKRLREAGLVRSQRRAHRVYYEIDSVAWGTFTRPLRDLCAIVEGISDEVAPNAGTRQGTSGGE